MSDIINNPGQTIRVEIYDRQYRIHSTADEKYTRQLAKSVDAAMRAVAEQTHTVESLRVAVLTAMHFADRYERLNARFEKLNGMISEKSSKIREALDAADKSIDETSFVE